MRAAEGMEEAVATERTVVVMAVVGMATVVAARALAAMEDWMVVEAAVWASGQGPWGAPEAEGGLVPELVAETGAASREVRVLRELRQVAGTMVVVVAAEAVAAVEVAGAASREVRVLRELRQVAGTMAVVVAAEAVAAVEVAMWIAAVLMVPAMVLAIVLTIVLAMVPAMVRGEVI